MLGCLVLLVVLFAQFGSYDGINLNLLAIWGVPFLMSKWIVSLINGLKFKVAMTIFDIRLKYSEWYGLSVLTTFLGYILPAKTSVIPRAIFLRRVFGFEYTGYAAMIVGVNLVSWLVVVVLFICAIWLGLGGNTNATISMLSVISNSVVLLLVLIAGFLLLLRFGRRFSAVLNNVSSSLSYMCDRRHSYQFLAYISHTIFMIVVQTSALLLAAKIAQVEISPVMSVVAVCAVNLAGVITVVPGNLVITEGVIVGVLVLAGVGMEASLEVALVSRLGSLIVQGGFGSYYIMRYGNALNIKTS